MSADSVAADQLISFVRRIEALEDEGKAINDDKSEVYKEARGNGFDTKIIRKVVAKRRLGSAERDEQDALFQLYWDAIHGVVRAHVENIDEFAANRSAALDALAAPDADIIDADGVVIESQPDHREALRQVEAGPVAKAGNQSTAARKDVRGLSTDETQGSSLPVVARNLEATDGSPVAPNQTAGTQAPPVDANNFISAFTTGPAQPVTIPAADPTVVVTASDRSEAFPPAAPVATRPDYTKPNPLCADPDDCGVHASWNHPCGACLRRQDAMQHQEALH